MLGVSKPHKMEEHKIFDEVIIVVRYVKLELSNVQSSTINGKMWIAGKR